MKYIVTFLIYLGTTLAIRARENNNSNANDSRTMASDLTRPPTYPVPVYSVPMPDNTLTVTGSASTYIPTNLIRIGYSIETKHKQAKTAFQNNNEISSSVSKLLENNGIPERNITTTQFSISPNYISQYISENNTYVSKFDGYTVTNSMDVLMSDLKQASSLVDQLVSAGVNRVNSISFEVSPEVSKNANNNLISKAVEDALAKAKLLAAPVNVEILGVRSVKINEGYSSPYPVLYAARAMDMESAGPKLYNSQNQQNMSVEVTFEIKNNGITNSRSSS
jgi:uncharacterized protein YggE